MRVLDSMNNLGVYMKCSTWGGVLKALDAMNN